MDNRYQLYLLLTTVLAVGVVAGVVISDFRRERTDEIEARVIKRLEERYALVPVRPMTFADVAAQLPR